MSTKLISAPSTIALALAALLATGCASQSPPDNARANNSASGQSDVVSQTNPIDQPAVIATESSMPVEQTAQYVAPAPVLQPMTPAPVATIEPAPMPSATTTMTTTDSNTSYRAEQPLPPRADRN